MFPITDFLSCTDPLDEFESLSYHQTRHAKTYVTGLAAVVLRETALLNPRTASGEVVGMIKMKRKKCFCAKDSLPLRQASRLDRTKTY
jgi:hypothetical protein